MILKKMDCHMQSLHDNDEFPVEVGQWVVVAYDGIEFPGEVVTCGETDVEVNVMHQSGNAWKWPDKIHNMIRQLDPPTVAGSRGQFTFKGFRTFIYIYIYIYWSYSSLLSIELL